MERIESLYYETGGKCYLSFSGGKDSMVVLALIKMCQDIYTLPINAIPAIYCNTGLELNATNNFVSHISENYYPNTVVIRPDPNKLFPWIITNYGKPMKSKLKSENLFRWQARKDQTALDLLVGVNSKFTKTRLANKDMHLLHPDFNIKVSEKCCKYLKKRPFEDFAKQNLMKGYITGLRIAEGGARELNASQRLKNGGKLCTAYRKNLIIKMPIIDWTDNDIEQFIQKYATPLSNAYTMYGYKRTGCFLCPFSLHLADDLKKLNEYEPNRYMVAMNWMQDVYIAQNVCLPFDTMYEEKRKQKWEHLYGKMRYESLLLYRPKKANKYKSFQPSLF
ncbi:phosphoadenosine phosphosulfate reductase family protein [[Clostridium] innocuum]|uniref:phosphoadenosine phosphosulfate reductase domain-containing protein n=1 Tax=Clostridium innocuum TaxID=1522 RepID=UPI001AF79864|nr:phosphoadenosine phosphosulfate reductase family protein [[Clostridium] innocuum]MDU1018795.1 phosphoadenosine phosphosulfate reductase family protein [Bifidobacterium breve]QSI26891.1 phosphoadenosine phosphosulfate reductase family protein [Erysipelotrichaceae bacterium 66202529]MCC2831858.1 phosphoadenosine phosphosulfate reductase family protein [[Clostridium] innocuum]MCR0248574.1 phosphoadenosine phosphosulfate reductase family protein [[Clostridium] innocuum]MCR0261085.1 phosphoadeno